MKDHSKQFLIDNIYILVDRNYHSYNENILNQYVVIDYDEHNIYLLSKHGLINMRIISLLSGFQIIWK